ncbi:MAG TPA: hypothetical protein VHT05_00110 [Candidatus Elarobacter sp.]|nr:hypothetical protein [Candidatus Elarobacter sp.]
MSGLLWIWKEANISMKRRTARVVRPFDPDDPVVVRAFMKAAKEAERRSLASPEAARATLYKLGFITKSGRLTKRYGG